MIALSRPSPGNITENFGPRPKPTPTSPAIHYGIDFGWGNGTAIYAAADGVVTSTSYSGAYGNRTVVNHGDGIETWYCHQSEQAVKAGDPVKRGQHIGTQGATGNVVGMHLHFELRIKGVAVDPAPYMTSTVGLNLTDLPAVPPSPDLEPFGDTMPSLFHLVTTTGNQAFIYQGAASQQIISDAFALAIEKGYGIKRIQVNEYDWNAISSTWGADLAALARTVGATSSASGLTVDDIAKAVNDEADHRDGVTRIK